VTISESHVKYENAIDIMAFHVEKSGSIYRTRLTWASRALAWLEPARQIKTSGMHKQKAVQLMGLPSIEAFTCPSYLSSSRRANPERYPGADPKHYLSSFLQQDSVESTQCMRHPQVA